MATNKTQLKNIVFLCCCSFLSAECQKKKNTCMLTCFCAYGSLMHFYQTQDDDESNDSPIFWLTFAALSKLTLQIAMNIDQRVVAAILWHDLANASYNV